MQQPKLPMTVLLRWFFSIPLILLGCWFYLASVLIGGGMHLDPMPGVGLLIAGGALAIMIGGHWLIRFEKQERIPGGLINIVLLLGSFSLVYGIARWVFETLEKVQTSEWGHSRPGEVLFRVCYGSLSAAALLAFNYRLRKATRRSQLSPLQNANH